MSQYGARINNNNSGVIINNETLTSALKPSNDNEDNLNEIEESIPLTSNETNDTNNNNIITGNE